MEVREPDARSSGVALTKQTDLGPVPVDWSVEPLSALSERIMVGIANAATHAYRDKGVLMFRNQNIKNGVVDAEDVLFIDPVFEQTYRNKRLKAGDLLTARTGYPGATAVVPVSCEGAQSFTTLITRPKPSCIDANYLCYFINGSAGKRFFEQAQIGGGQKNVNAASLKQLPVGFPTTLAEQQAIAEALSDADALIESLSLLLAKKRQIKQGAMQELLTGKKRLPGFCGDWEGVCIGSVAEVDPENLPAGTNRAFSFNYIALEDIERGVLNSHTEQLFESAPSRARRRLRHGDVLVATVRPNLQSHLLFKEQRGEWVCSTGFAVVRSSGRLHPGYLFEHLFSATVNRQIDVLLTGSNYPAINSRDVRRMEIPLPSFEEQAAIFDTLSSMNEEIASLEAKLAKIRDLKQGMMQALLTGRIRLVQPGSNIVPLPTRPAATKPPSTQPAHNWQINEAVVIGVLAQRFGSEKFPLPRKRRVKLTYLLHRYAEGRAEGYLKKAAGPYDPNTKYKGPEQIALKNGYVRALRNEKYEGFVAGDKIEQAQRYFEQWYGAAMLEWLERFHYRKTDDLELLATVDMAMVDLAANGEQADVAGVKRVIAAHPEWLPKLSRELFSDRGIAAAIAECQTLFDN